MNSNVAHHIVKYLINSGADNFFGIPGGPVSPIFEAILSQGARLVESRHETMAAFEAAGYYRTTGKVPVLVITSGPGITNAITGIASAFLENIPMVILAGDVPWSKGGLLVQDSGPNGIHAEALLTPLTRGTFRASAQPNAVPGQIAKLFRLASDKSNPGPTALILPIDIARAACDCADIISALPINVQPRNSLSMSLMSAVEQELSQAKRPLLLLGKGCRPFVPRIISLLHNFPMPFATTPTAKGIISEEHPLSLRNAGFGASLWSKKYVQGVDVCLALGTDLDDISIGATPYSSTDTKLIHVDRDPQVFNRNLPTSMPIQADLEDFLYSFNWLVKERAMPSELQSILNGVKKSPPSLIAPYAETTVITPAQAVQELQRVFPDARFVTDIGEHMMFALHYLTIKNAGDFSIQISLGSMGSGIGTAIGQALGDCSRPVVCIVGDGCMQMYGMEVLLAVKEKLPIVFAVFNDARYGMVHHGYKSIYGKEVPWDMPRVDFSLWARSMGMKSLSLTTSNQLYMFNSLCPIDLSQGPVLFDIAIDPNQHLSSDRNEALMRMSLKTSE